MAGFGNSTSNTNKQKISKKGPQLLEAAMRAHKIGDITNAEALYLNAINSGFHHEIAFSNLGVIYKNTGRTEKAIVVYERAIAKNPNFAAAYTNLGNLYKNLGQLEQALTATLKSLEVKPDNPETLTNLGSIYQELGNLDQALAATLKALELKPDNLETLINLGKIHKDLGNIDQALIIFKEAFKRDRTNEQAATELALTHYYNGGFRDGITAISNIDSKEAGNILLSLYLCANDKINFNRCANILSEKQWLNPQGIAAIDHANILYNQTLDNGLSGRSTIDSILTQKINTQELSNSLMQQILNRLSNGSLQFRAQGHLANGLQTSGNILDLPEEPFQALKKLLIQKIDDYNQLCDINTDKNFQANWQANLYRLKGWAIIMNKGGNLKAHNHEGGWLTGTFYLQMPEEKLNTNEGAIEFSHQGPKYPRGISAFETRLIRPSARDLNIFCSSLFHRTLPFQSEKQRICIAFDITKQNSKI